MMWPASPAHRFDSPRPDRVQGERLQHALSAKYGAAAGSRA